MRVAAAVLCGLIGASVALAGPTDPIHVKVALGGEATSMTVSWQTYSLGDAYTPIVYFGTDQSSLGHKAEGYTISFNDFYSFQHHCPIKGLRAGTRYWYKVGNVSNAQSDVYSFVTAPAQPSPNQSIKVAMYGDMGPTGSEENIARLIANKDQFNLIAHIGDISYADDRAAIPIGKNPKYESIWDGFLNQLQPLTSAVPYMVSPGNHDASCHVAGNFGCPPSQVNYTAYRHRFRMPSPESGGVENMWYSFDYGPVHFVSISTETDFPNAPEGKDRLIGPRAGPFGDQLGWLKQDLARANANRDQVPWVIVYGHRPMYSSGGSDFPLHSRRQLREVMEDTFYEAGVDMFFAGHVHGYERHWPVYKGETTKSYDNPRAPVHVIVGTGGCVEGHSGHWKSTPEWINARNGKDWGYGLLEVHNATTLTWSLVRAHDGTTADEMTLYKKH